MVIYNVRDERVQINPGGSRPAASAASSGPRAHRARAEPLRRRNGCIGDAPQRERRMSRLRVEGLAKKYRSRQVVKDLSIEVSSGEVVGLLGPERRRQDHRVLHDRRTGAD